MTEMNFDLVRVERIEDIQYPSKDGNQVALWFIDTNGRRVCLVFPPGVTIRAEEPGRAN